MTTERSRGLLDSLNLAELPGLMHLSPEEFDTAIALHGSSGELRRAMPCPCVRIDTRTPKISCRHCKGIGQLYPAHLREPMMVLDLQRRSTAKLIAAGKVPVGTIQLTFPAGYVPGFGDMFLPDEEEHVVTQTLFRDGTVRATDAHLRLDRVSPDQVKPSLRPRFERLLYDNVCCIEAVAFEDDDGDMVFSNPSEYHVDKDGRWTWRKDCGPASGRAWVVRYRAPAAYLVHTSVPVYRTEADQAMPHLVTAQALYRLTHEDQGT